MIIALAVMLLAITVGCGQSGPKTYPVSGTVTLDGAPLQNGKIFLVDPDMRLDSDVGDIVDGRFEFRAKPGMKRVELRAVRETGEISHFGGPVTEEALPAHYNSASELTEEVTSDARQNVYTFQLESERR